MPSALTPLACTLSWHLVLWAQEVKSGDNFYFLDRPQKQEERRHESQRRRKKETMGNGHKCVCVCVCVCVCAYYCRKPTGTVQITVPFAAHLYN
jgi:hypothetical protein